MPKSMTGYGKSLVETDSYTQVWEVRGVNSRFLDLKWRLPLFLRPSEAALERVVREQVARGRLEVHLEFSPKRTDMWKATLDTGLANAMLDELDALAKAREIPHAPDLNRLLGLSQLWREVAVEPDPTLFENLSHGLRLALTDFNDARSREGRALADDLLARLATLSGWRDAIEAAAPAVKAEKMEQLAARIALVLEKAGLEPAQDRLLQETAILADKLDVSEELTRLSGHLGRLEGLLREGGEIGKKLDFLVQEAFREINTCGNKAQNLDVSRLVVDFKAELEKCREQVQNLE
ncbi:YicC/YloC family endoribonuclease [Solidesulfovibrio sp.]|uniref:YicC/YloC family endoribonuclease n=1 Tax=Solidesulfovibrio sp. TaxID=2910990 RepID=UPI002B20003E|nr:YicC/YloC family endoribonuclease [Solidesulfovibrio sp.]MEA5089747.1 YicC/YloC family endoribonuclease [Solidesulfovibrio sp.]